MLKKLKTNGVQKILWEIPTYPYDTEKTGIRAKFESKLDKIWRKKLKKYVDRVVTFSDTKKIFGIKTINTSNGIDVAATPERVVEDSGNDIHMIAVAVLNNWHGYDRVIRGLYEYYNKPHAQNVYFHLVGDGPALEGYKALVDEFGLENKVITYGYRTKDEVDAIYNKCDIAIESLGWHRSNVTLGTSIKVREYLAKGLPIIASTPIDIFPKGWKYLLYFPQDDSPIEIRDVIEFYDGLIKQESNQNIAKEIRNYAINHCDIAQTMKPILEFYKKYD